MSERRDLAGEMLAFSAGQLREIGERFFPGWMLPRSFAGHHRPPGEDACTLLEVLTRLDEGGVPTIGGPSVREIAHRLMRSLYGAHIHTFYSYFLAEALQRFGPPDDASPADISTLHGHCDTTSIYDPGTGGLRNYNNNFWFVLARAESARQGLGLLSSPAILEQALSRGAALLNQNLEGFFDDSANGDGHFDSYSWDSLLFAEPLWGRLIDFRLRPDVLEAHHRLAWRLCHENGALAVWGRSTSALGLCLRTGWFSTAIRRGLEVANRGPATGLVAESFDKLRSEWFSDLLVNAHRQRTTDSYRGLPRLLQMTFNILAKIAFAAVQLRRAGSPDPSPICYPHQDILTPMDQKGAAVWTFRDEHWSLVLPFTGGSNSDYAPWPRSVGILEVPAASHVLAGVPVAVFGKNGTVTSVHRPESVTHSPGRVNARWDHWRDLRTGETIPGQILSEVRVDGPTIHIRNEWTFESTPDALWFVVPEARERLVVLTPPDNSTTASCLSTSGTCVWRSQWNELPRIYQWDFTPSRKVNFHLSLRRD